MYLVKLVIALVTFYTAFRALRQWTVYKESLKWTIIGLSFRISVTLIMSFLPWYQMIFGDDSRRPKNMNNVAQTYMGIMVSIPVITLSMTITPGLVAGARGVQEVMPFSIFPYMIILFAPTLVMISIWP